MSKPQSFPRIMAALGWETPPDVKGDIYISPEHFGVLENKLDEAITAKETAVQHLADANTKLTNETGKLNEANGKITKLETAANDAQTKITSLEAEVEKLKKSASGQGTTIVTGEDGKTGGEAGKKIPSYADPNNPINQYADKRLPKKKAVAESSESA